jgi:hypothetical protein
MCDKVMCEYNACEHFLNLDEGEGYAPVPYCDAAEECIEDDEQECVAPDKKKLITML